MIPRGLKTEAFLAELSREIQNLGADAFAHAELPNCDATELYSGPEDCVYAEFNSAMKAAGLRFQNNWHISKNHANKIGAKRIDDTHVGKILIDLDLKDYFAEVYGANRDQVENAIYQAWALSSREFVKASKKHLYLTGCAGSHTRIMRRVEIPATIKHNGHTDVNAASWTNFQKRKSPRERFRYSCLTRLLLARREVCAEYTQENVIAYQTQLAFYRMARNARFTHGKRRAKPFFKGTAEEHIGRMQTAVVKCAVLNRQPIASIREYEEATGFRPYSAANPSFTNAQCVLI